MTPKAAPPRQGRTKSLQQAASTVFVLTAVLPQLIFVWIVYTLDAMQEIHVQVGIALSLGVSMLGFSILRTIMRRTSEVLQLLVRAEPPAPPAAAAIVNPEAAPDPSPATPPETDGQPAAAAQPKPERERPAAAPPRKKTPSTASSDAAPAIGSISELRDAENAVARRWRREAEPLIGQAVRVSVVNFDQPEVGTIVRVTDDGLILENDGSEFGVLWRFVSGIEADQGAETAGQPGR